MKGKVARCSVMSLRATGERGQSPVARSSEMSQTFVIVTRGRL